MISHLPVSDFWAKKINFQEGYKIKVFIFTTRDADPKFGEGEWKQLDNSQKLLHERLKPSLAQPMVRTFLQGGKKVELARQEIHPPWWSDLETQIVRETYNVS